MVVGVPGTFNLIGLPDCVTIRSRHRLASAKLPCVRYHRGRLYCLCREANGKKRELCVIDSTNYQEICRWEVSDREALGSFAIMSNEVYVGNQSSVEVYTLRGVRMKRSLRADIKLSTDIASCGTHQLAVCDVVANRVIVFNKDTTVAWSAAVSNPVAICCDEMRNLWVLSKENKEITVIGNAGEPLMSILLIFLYIPF